MKKFLFVGIAIILLGVFANSTVWAHSRYNFGFHLGYYGYYPYYPSYYYPPAVIYPPYYPPTVVVPATPPVYIESDQGKSTQTQDYYWYYCRNPEGYYPYVKQCPEGWLQVTPQPPAQ